MITKATTTTKATAGDPATAATETAPSKVSSPSAATRSCSRSPSKQTKSPTQKVMHPTKTPVPPASKPNKQSKTATKPKQGKTKTKTPKPPTEVHTPSTKTNDPEDLFDTDSNEEMENYSTTGTFNPIFWNGDIPQPDGVIAKAAMVRTYSEQVQSCEEIAAYFLAGNEQIASTLNNYKHILTYLLLVPASRKLKVVCGLGTGEALTGPTAPEFRSSILVLVGDYEPGVTVPNVLLLPQEAFHPVPTCIPSYKKVEDKRASSDEEDDNFWFKPRDCNSKYKLPNLIPVPPALVCDKFEGEIDAMVVYKRWRNMRDMLEQVYPAFDKLVSCFCRAMLVTPTAKEKQERLSSKILFLSTPALAKEWKMMRMEDLTPQVFEEEKKEDNSDDNIHHQQTETVTQLQPTPHTTSTLSVPQPTTPPIKEPPTKSVGSMLLAELTVVIVTATKAVQQQSTKSTSEEIEEKKIMDSAAAFGLSESGFARLLKQCGLCQGEEDAIPAIWKQLAEKNASKTDKITSITLHLSANPFWKDTKVKPLATLITMIAKRAFEGEMTLSSLASSTKGLTPFAVPEITTAEMEAFNKRAAALDSATTTTVKDVVAVQRAAEGPKLFAALLSQLKRFGNLIHALFGEDCPLFIALEEMVESLNEYGDIARATMSLQTMSSIVWITHLQSRHFAAGLMVGATAQLAAFTMMLNCINTMQPVVHGEVPPALYRPSPPVKQESSFRMKRNGSEVPATEGPTRHKRKASIVKMEHYHPKLKVAMAPLMIKGEKLPGVELMCRVAGTTSSNLFPAKPNICIKSTLFGSCFEDCKRQHIPITMKKRRQLFKS